MQKPCPSQEELSGFVFGTLSEADADAVTDHLLKCDVCEDTVQEIERTADQVVNGLRQPEAKDPFMLESGCDRVVELVAAIGRDPTYTRVANGEALPPVELPDLGTIRSYRLLVKLGQGGMGAVYKALHVDLDKIVALKVLPKDFTQDEAAIARFRREMKAVGKLHHPNIVQATDAGMEDGTHYLVMELVDGNDLSKLVANRGPLPIAEACELIRQAAEGLQHAHEHGLVHRDIKPSNLMLTTNGKVKILDLGLALLGGQHHEGIGELTTTGQIMGTIDYMAPEQGSDTHNVDIRADVYSLGATLFKLLTGKAPFEGEQFKSPIKKLMALANTQAPRVDALRPEIPKPLADLVQRMLSKSPKDRPTPPSELARLLAPFAQGADLTALLSNSTTSTIAEPAPTVDKPVNGSTAAGATILVDTDVSGTLDAALIPSPAALAAIEQPSFPTFVETSQPMLDLRRSRTWLSKYLEAALIAGGLLVLLLGVVLFKFVTRDGTVYIELPAGIPSVTVTIDGEEAEVEFAEDGSSLRLFVDPGTHELVVTTPNNIRLTTDNNRFEMSAGGVERIRAWLEPPTDVERMPSDGGTQLASTQPAPSPGRLALQFDELGDRVELPLQYDGSFPITFEMWFHPQPQDIPRYDQGTMLHVGPISIKHLPLEEQVASIVYDQSEGVSPVGATSNSETRRTYVAAQWSGTEWSMFVNGQRASQGHGGPERSDWVTRLMASLANEQMYLGVTHLPTDSQQPWRHPFFGCLDELRISRVARYADDFTPAEHFEADEHTLALYHFDEGQGDRLTDSSGNGHHGTIHGATWVREVAPDRWEPYLPEQTQAPVLALQFDELGDRVELPLQYNGSTPLTMEVWCAMTADEASRSVLHPFCSAGPVIGFGINSQEPYFAATISDPHDRSILTGASLAFSPGRRHIACQWSGDELSLYVDGRRATNVHAIVELRERVAEIFAASGPQPFTLGVRDLDRLVLNQQFHGTLDEVRISNVLRYTADFTPESRFAADEHTLALYHFDEGQGDTLVDSSGNGHDGTIHGATWVREVSPGTWVPYDAEREVAEWVIAQGGFVDARFAAGNAVRFQSVDELPAEPFDVWNVNLFNTAIEDADLVRLTGLRNLNGLYLDGTQVGDAGMQYVGRITSLQTLTLRDTNVTDAGVEQLGDLQSLQELRLSRLEITDASIPTICSLPRLRLLSMEGASITDVGVGQLSALTDLNQLVLSETEITGGTLGELADLRILRGLHLHRTNVTDETLRILGGMEQLHDILLDGTPVTDEGLSHLAGLHDLRDLALRDTAVTDNGLAHLHGLQRLEFVWANRSNVTADGVAALHASLPNCRIEWDGGIIEPSAGPASGNLALQFDGEDDSATVPSLEYDGSHPLTMEAWVRPHDERPHHYEVILMNHFLKMGLGPDDGEPYWRGIKMFAFAPYIHSSDQMRHLALVYDSETIEWKVFLDGQVLVSRTASDLIDNESGDRQLTIGWGRELVPSNFFRGVIDEVRVSNVIRYTEDFTPEQRFAADEHTLALYHFDEGQGNTLVDSSGNGHDGTIHGATWVREVSPGTWEPFTADPAVERFVAEAVLRAGGKVGIVVPQGPVDAGQRQSYAYGTNLVHELPLLGPELTIESSDGLPAEPFHIIRVQLRQQAVIDSALLESLARVPFLFELNLERSAVNDAHAAVIGRMSQLRYLNVGVTSLTDAGLRELSRLANLRYLAVWNVPGITDDGLEQIARLTNLVEIYLHDNPQITDRGIASLRDLPHVGWLWLEGTGITDAALESLSGFEELDSLRLSRTRINGPGLTHLSRLQKLNWLFLQESDITDEFGVLLKDVPFRSLWLSGTSVGDATLEAIAGRPDIHQLTLNGTAITDAGLAHLQGTRIVHLSASNTALTGSGLADLDIVQVLDLSQTQLTDEAAQLLSRYATLSILNVADTPLSEETVQFLHEALPHCTIYSNFGTFEPLPDGIGASSNLALRFDGDDYVQLPWKYDGQTPLTVEATVVLDAPQQGWGNVLTDAQVPGGLNLAIFESTPHWMAYGNNASAVSAILTDEELTYPSRIHLAGVYDDGFLTFYINGRKQKGRQQVLGGYAASGMPVLIGANPDPVPEGQPFGISDMFRGIIDEVRISNTARYTEDFTPELRFTTDAQTLALYHFDEVQGDRLIDSSGNGHHGTIHGATWAREVGPNLWMPADPDRDAIAWAFSIGATVNRFDEHGSQIPVASAQEIPTDGAWSINLSETPNWTSADLARLSNCRRMLGVNLLLTPVTDEGLAHFAGLEQLQYLHLQECKAITDAGIAQLYGLHELVQLSLQGTAASADTIAWAAQNPNLQGFYIGPTDVDDLSPLTSLPQLAFLIINGNSPLTLAQVQQVAEMPQVRELTLSPGVTDEGLEHLAKLTQLDHLFLIGSNISGEGLSHLAGLERLHALSLKDNSHAELRLDDLPAFANLTYLDLTNCAISDDDLAAVVALPNLDGLLLNGTPITNSGVERLRDHPKLAVLDLRECAVTDDCIDALCTIASLREIWIENTQLTAEGVGRLQNALPDCRIQSGGGIVEPVATADSHSALQFDGESDYVELPVPLGLTEQFTVELWCEPAAVAAGAPRHATLARWGLFDIKLWEEEQQWQAFVWDPQANASARGEVLSFVPGRSHVAAQWDGTTLAMFVDGVRATPAESNSGTVERVLELLQRNADSPLLIGNALDPSGQPIEDYQYHGRIDEVRVSSIVRYTENFTPESRFAADEYTLGLYHFDEGQGETLIDSSGNEHHGTFTGATWVASPFSIDYAYEREVAEWVLALGGQLKVRVGDSSLEDYRDVRVIDELPTEPFVVWSITLLDNTNLGGEALSHLQALSEIWYLALSGSQIGDAELAHLNGLMTLGEIHLNGTQVSDAGIETLREFSPLTFIDVRGTQITTEGVAALHAAIPGCRIEWDGGIVEAVVVDYAYEREVAEWVLSVGGGLQWHLASQAWAGPSGDNIHSENELPNEPFTVRSVNLDGIRQITSDDLLRLPILSELRAVSLKGASIDDRAAAHLANCRHLEEVLVSGPEVTSAALPLLTSLDLLHLDITSVGVTQESLELISRMNRLEHINFPGNDLSPLDLSVLSRLPSLRGLGLHVTGLADEDLAELLELRTLMKLHLGETEITDAGLATVAHLTWLEDLSINKNPAITDAGIAVLSSLTQLKKLYLPETSITAEGVAALHAALPNCRIEWDGGVSEPLVTSTWPPTPEQQAFFDHVATLTAEEQVEAVRQKLMETNPKFDGTAEHSIEGTSVTVWRFNVDHVSQIWPVRALSALKTLHCTGTGNSVTGEGLQDLSPLAGMALSELRVDKTNVSDLRPVSTLPLTTLSIWGCPVSDLSPIANLRLVTLNIAGTNIVDLSPLRDMPLVFLEFGSVPVSDLGPLAGMPLKTVICPGVPVSDLLPLREMELVDLRLDACPITDDVLLVLDANPGLRILSLTSTAISDVGLAGICERFANLRSLSLTNTAITDTGIVAIQNLSQLETLSLSRLPLTDQSIETLEHLAQLKSAVLTQTQVTQAGIDRLHAALPGCRIEWDGGVIEPIVDSTSPEESQ